MTAEDLTGRTALVTGASQGIGAAIARALDRRGARVAIAARDAERLAELGRDLRNEPVVIPVDLGRPDGPARVVEAIDAAGGRLDILVNNAGQAVRCPVDQLDAATIDRLHALNVRAPLLLVAGLVPHLRRSTSASVVNLSSVSGLVGTGHRAAYAATKGALDAATRSLARELGSDGIRVNAVAPGVVDTQLWARNKAVEGVVEAVEALTPLGRWARPDDVADVVAFLASDDARFVTGETIGADGGMSRTLPLPTGAV